MVVSKRTRFDGSAGSASRSSQEMFENLIQSRKTLHCPIFFKSDCPSLFVKQVMEDLKTFKLNVTFTLVSDKKNARVVIGLHTNMFIQEVLGNEFSGLSVAQTSGVYPRNIWINQENYYKPPAHWKDKREYQKYVIRHELLHTYGIGHVKSSSNKPCHIMTPQTKNISCIPNHEIKVKG